jgi:kynurenine formamidase
LKIVDLSVPIHHGMPVYPGDPEVAVEVAHTYGRQGWELRKLTMGTHTGTHVDAPSHMHRGAATLDELPLTRFFGPARIVRAEESWPAERGLFFAEPVGEELFGRLASLAPPFVGGELSEELERSLLGAGIVTYTSLQGLDRLPPGVDFMFYGFPLRIREGDGSPVRAVAIFADDIPEFAG